MSFLALVLLEELERRLARKGLKVERGICCGIFVEVREEEVRHGGKRYILRTPLKGVAGKVFGAVPPPAREVSGAKTVVQAP